MIELTSNQLIFRFPEIHPECSLTITLHRTLRIPDDGREYPLPPSLGHFPAVHVDDYASRVPKKWLGRGGIAIPMWQSEAMWLQFSPSRPSDRGSPWPFAVKVACGKVSAVTGKKWSKKLSVDDYLVCPLQPWLDGFATEEGQIKQFVAAALGLGATVEGQITGKEEFGGVQLEVIPMAFEEFDKRFPKLPPVNLGGTRILRGMSFGAQESGNWTLSSCNGSNISYTNTSNLSDSLVGAAYSCNNVSLNAQSERSEYYSPQLTNEFIELPEAGASLDMGMGMGGRMKQQIFKDPYGLAVWSKDQKARIFIHMCNSLGWKHLTGKEPPTLPLTAANYTAAGMPWFHFYEEGAKSQQGTKELKKVKSMAEIAAKKKLPLLPENQPANIPMSQTIGIKQKGVRSGSWVK